MAIVPDLHSRLIDFLVTQHTHTIVAELIKNIIAMSTPAGITEGLQNGPASNRFARELARREIVSNLMIFILYDLGPGHNVVPEDAEGLETQVAYLLSNSPCHPSHNPSPSLLNQTHIFHTVRHDSG